MFISPVNSSNQHSRPSFGIRFSKTDIAKLTKSAKNEEGAAGLPQLYTILDYCDELSGKLAKITEKNISPHGKHYVISVDGKPIAVGDPYEKVFSFFKRTFVGDKSDKNFIRMPFRIFEEKWFANRKIEFIPSNIAYRKEKLPIQLSEPQKIKPYNVVKEFYATGGDPVMISNIEILSKEKTESGRAELDAISEKLTQNSRKLFDKKRKIAQKEIEKQKERPEIYKL